MQTCLNAVFELLSFMRTALHYLIKSMNVKFPQPVDETRDKVCVYACEGTFRDYEIKSPF